MAVRLHVRLTDSPLSGDAAQAFISDPAAGATVVFTGAVRQENEGRPVVALEYESFEEHASRQLTELAEDIAGRWPQTVAVWLEHRTGTLAVGEVAVVVAVSAGHRHDAFEAARYGIDALKATVAIWKKEHWGDGTPSRWTGVG